MCSKPTDFLKELRQYLLVYHLLIKSLAQHLDAFKVILAKREEVDAVFLFINKIEAFLCQLIESVGLELA